MVHRTATHPFALAAAAIVVWAGFAPADEPTGEQLYRQHCSRCHGKAGEGTKKAPRPLVGDRSVHQLGKQIDETMPEDDPDKLDAAESLRVAEYVHQAFYSPTAQARLQPPRVALSRLTVAQYRNTVADLVGSFRPAPKPDDRYGLKGEYYNARNFRGDKKVFDRIDPGVRFHFGTEPPEKDKFDPHQFSIRWEGTVLPPESGTYEFVVRTEHAARLWVNDPKVPVIDAWVKSGNDTEFRGAVDLLAGRAYPLRLEFSKAKQGVDDSKKQKKDRPVLPASVALLWKRPHGVDEVLPADFLSPGSAPPGFVVTTPFPPDDRSLGWERGTTVSKEWDAATTDAALEAVGYVAARLDELAGVKPADTTRADNSGNPAHLEHDAKKEDGTPAAERAAKLRAFARRFAERAFRRPLTPELERQYVGRPFEGVDPELGAKRAVLLVLKSPRFLYREAGAGSDGYAVASRLAFALWDSPPDDELLQAAADGKLATPEQVRGQAERMLRDSRAKAKVRDFLLTWLKVKQPPDLAKDRQRFPGFDDATAADLRTSLERFLDAVASSDDADFRRLLLDDRVPVNERLAKLYGVAGPEDGPGWRQVRLDPGKRAGVLTHPYMLAAFSYTAESSPIHRGVFIARGVLGLNLRPPQEAFTPLAPDLHPKLTTRERVALQTSPQNCATCHAVINPLGFTLEGFDAAGRLRAADRGKPVDTTGAYHTRDGADVTFAGPADLARFLADSPEVHAAFVEQAFHHLVRQPVRAYGPEKLDELRKEFAANGYNIRRLLAAVAVTGALDPGSRTAAR
jgi:mono/diheme cytochrome c family protein